MSNTYKIREVTVTIPKMGIVSRDAEGHEFKCGEIYHINLFAMRPGWRARTSDFDGLIVGRLDISGYTESPYSRTQKIIMPNGYELVALRVHESGRPMTWDSLPVQFVGGFFGIGSAVDALDGIVDLPRYRISSDLTIQQKIADALDTALVRYYEQFGNTEPDKTAVVFLADRWVAIEGSYTPDEMRDALEQIKRNRKIKADVKAMTESLPYAIKGGEVFIKDAVIGNGIVSSNYSVKMSLNHGGKLHSAGMTLGVEDGKQQVTATADDFKLTSGVGSAIGVTGAAIEWPLPEPMRKAIIRAVSESDLFTSLQSGLGEQAASVVSLKQSMFDAVNDAVSDAIRNAVQPGGAIWVQMGGR